MNTFPVNPENAVEMARLLNQHTLVSNALGGVLVELSDEQKSNIHDVLDLACGPGGWVLEAARTFPHMQVTGVDISTVMVEYGNTMAQSQALRNAHFVIMNIFKLSGFADNSFDLVNGRLLSSITRRDTWPALMDEGFRICRVGGIMRLADWELSPTSLFSKWTWFQYRRKNLWRYATPVVAFTECRFSQYSRAELHTRFLHKHTSPWWFLSGCVSWISSDKILLYTAIVALRDGLSTAVSANAPGNICT